MYDTIVIGAGLSGWATGVRLVLLIDIVTLAMLLFLAQAFFRRAGKAIAWGCFLALPLILTPYWIRGDSNALRDGAFDRKPK